MTAVRRPDGGRDPDVDLGAGEHPGVGADVPSDGPIPAGGAGPTEVDRSAVDAGADLRAAARSGLSAALFNGVRPVGARMVWALVVDVLLVVLVTAVAVGWVVAAGARPVTTLVVGLLVAAGALTLVGADVVRHGRSPGHRLLGLRSVDRRTALPGNLRVLAPRHGLTADLRHGRDPLQLVPAALAPLTDDVDRWHTGTGRAAPAGVVLIGDDGSVLPIPRSTIVGRNPVDPAGLHRLLGIPDLSRTISRSHALLEPDGSTVWVTDLGSANGTAVAAPGQAFEYLQPGVRVAAPVGAQLALGDRVVRVADTRRAEVPA
jgi:hypothetical protein